jgi:hypothetical protein
LADALRVPPARHAEFDGRFEQLGRENFSWSLLVKSISFLLLAFLVSSTPSSAENGLKIDTVVIADGDCDFRVNGQKLECESKFLYTTFKNHRVAFSALPKVLAVVDFSGEHDIQPTPETYALTVDRLILSGGTIVQADGSCLMNISTDGKRIHNLTCKALARDGRQFEFDFKPADKDVKITHADELFAPSKEESKHGPVK